jgi:hypothetical protein
MLLASILAETVNNSSQNFCKIQHVGWECWNGVRKIYESPFAVLWSMYFGVVRVNTISDVSLAVNTSELINVRGRVHSFVHECCALLAVRYCMFMFISYPEEMDFDCSFSILLSLLKPKLV